MPEPCLTCGNVHEGDCPTEGAAATAVAEPCAWCGERHPATMKCREWAQQQGEIKATPWGTSGFSSLPPPPPVVHTERPARDPRTQAIYATLFRALLAALALVGAVAIGKVVYDRLGTGSGAATASLPTCTPARVRQNLVRAQSVLAQANAGLVRRIDQDDALLLSAGPECSERLFTLYAIFIGEQNACIAQPQSGACAQRDVTLSAVAQQADSE
jgi:hypothetical protein